MRLGAKLFGTLDNPEAWVAAVQAKGYRAAYCPVVPGTPASIIADYRRAAGEADIVIAEVGAWSNPLADDPAEREVAHAKCVDALALADEIGARCCVNIAGSRGARWAGPHPDNLSEATFEMIVASVQRIIDEVQPTGTVYALEAMPWIFPDSVASYRRLIEAIDRPAFAVHCDPVNLVNSPACYFANDQLIRDFVRELGPQIRSVHIKDILLHDKLTVHLDEVRPGQGGLALDVLLGELDSLADDLPVMLEHLPSEAAYDAAAAHVRAVAAQVGVVV